MTHHTRNARLRLMAAAALTLTLLLGARPFVLRAQDASDHRPVVSPDGHTLAFMSDRSGVWAVYLMDLNGGQPERVSDDPAGEWYPDWSPDGSHLVYHRWYTDEGARRLFVYDVAAARELPLTPASGDRSYARWSADGAALYFVAEGAAEGRVHRIGVRGDGEGPILQAPGRQHDPAPSPDGRWIAVIRVFEEGDAIVLVSTRSDEVRRLTPIGAGKYGLDWSPDATRIAYNTDTDGDHELHVIDVASGRDRQITSNEWRDHLPRWLPDGETLVFTAARGEVERLYTIRTDGSGLREIDTGHGR